MSNQMRRAIQFARQGERRRARDLFITIITENPENELAWLWLVDLVDSPRDKIVALENALTLNPDNPRARRRLSKLRILHEPPPAPMVVDAAPSSGNWEPPPDETWLQLARRLQEEGRLEEATLAYQQAIALAPSSRERQAARQHLGALERRQAARMSNTRPTTLELFRLGLGPLLLYLLLVIVHAAFRPWRVLPLLCLGSPLVLAGGLLVAGATTYFVHPWWQSIFGETQLRPPRRRTVVGLAGFVLLLLPYLLLFHDAYQRLLANPVP